MKMPTKRERLSRFEDNQREIAEFRQRMTEWLQDTEQIYENV